MPKFGCLSEPPQALRRFGLVMMRAWMNRTGSVCNLKMVSTGSDCRIWVSEQTSSSLVRASLFKSLQHGCMNKDPDAIAWWCRLAAMPNIGCQIKPPQALRKSKGCGPVHPCCHRGQTKPSEAFRRFVRSQHCGHACQLKPF